jgi:hypothetical protein
MTGYWLVKSGAGRVFLGSTGRNRVEPAAPSSLLNSPFVINSTDKLGRASRGNRRLRAGRQVLGFHGFKSLNRDLEMEKQHFCKNYGRCGPGFSGIDAPIPCKMPIRGREIRSIGPVDTIG